MPFYRCFIRGEHFPGECIGLTDLYGFYTTHWVQALSVAQAELRAVEAIRKDPSFALPEGFPKPADARVFVEEIVRVRKLPRFRGGGATWFREDADDDARTRRAERREAARNRTLSRKPGRRSIGPA